MSDETMERLPARRATKVLCEQLVGQMRADQQHMVEIAFETEGLSPTDGWKFDMATATFVRPKVAP